MRLGMIRQTTYPDERDDGAVDKLTKDNLPA